MSSRAAALLVAALASAAAAPARAQQAPAPLPAIASWRSPGGEVRLWADELELRSAEDLVLARGEVVMTDGRQLVMAGALALRPSDLTLVLEDATVVIKVLPLPPDTPLDDPAALRALGRNAQVLDAEGIERLESGLLVADDARFTLCDCGPGAAPTWSVRASTAELEPDERVDLWWPVFCLKDVPVAALPWLRFPVGERRTGLLMPRVLFTERDKLVVSEELFVTLGESADLTFELTGLNALALGDEVPPRPRAGVELRYVPTAGLWGSVSGAAVVEDPNPRTSPASPADRGSVARWHVRARHEHRFDARARMGVDLALVSDQAYVQHYPGDIGPRESNYTRSRIAGLWRGDDLLVHGAALYTQKLRGGAESLFDEEARARDVHRLPDAGFVLADVQPFDGPVLVGFEARAVQFTNLGPARRELEAPPAEGPQDELLRVTRLSLRPRLSAPFALAGVARVEPWLLAHHALYLVPDTPGYPARRGHLAAGLRVESELARAWPALLHSVRLSGGAFSIPEVFSTQPELRPALDLADTTAPLTRLWADLGTRLSVAGDGPDLRLAAGPRWDPDRPRPFYEGEALLDWGPVALGAALSVDRAPWVRRLATRAELSPWAGARLGLRYDRVQGGGSPELFPCLDAPFGLPPDQRAVEPCARVRGIGDLSPVSEVSTLTVAPRLPLFAGLIASYRLLYSFEPLSVRTPDGAEREVHALLHQGGLEYRSPCDCLAAGADLVVRPDTTGDCEGGQCLGVGLWVQLGAGASRSARPGGVLGMVR